MIVPKNEMTSLVQNPVTSADAEIMQSIAAVLGSLPEANDELIQGLKKKAKKVESCFEGIRHQIDELGKMNVSLAAELCLQEAELKQSKIVYEKTIVILNSSIDDLNEEVDRLDRKIEQTKQKLEDSLKKKAQAEKNVHQIVTGVEAQAGGIQEMQAKVQETDRQLNQVLDNAKNVEKVTLVAYNRMAPDAKQVPMNLESAINRCHSAHSWA